MVIPDSYVGVCYLDIDEQSVWRIVARLPDGTAFGFSFILENILVTGERREVESQWILPGGHYQLLTEMEVIAWMAK